MFEALIVIVIVVLLAATVWIYNLLVKDQNQVLAAWSDIDVQLKRRHDLVPQLVNAVKAYADYERATTVAITELRSKSEATNHLPEKALIENEIEALALKLTLLAEAYPDLKADESFRQLSQNLSEVEDHIQYARRYYNGSVRIFNTRIQSFPNFLIARPLRFHRAEFFEVSNALQRESPTVELN